MTMHKYAVEYTDTFGGGANYSWVRRASVSVPEWPHFKGWDGNGRIEPKGFRPYLMREAKAAVGLTGVRGSIEEWGDTIVFRPYRTCTVMFITYHDE
jgi:hypothetical protein